MPTAEENPHFNRAYLEAELSRLKALLVTLQLRIETLEGAGMEASGEKQQLAQINEQIARTDAQLKAVKR